MNFPVVYDKTFYLIGQGFAVLEARNTVLSETFQHCFSVFPTSKTHQLYISYHIRMISQTYTYFGLLQQFFPGYSRIFNGYFPVSDLRNSSICNWFLYPYNSIGSYLSFDHSKQFFPGISQFFPVSDVQNCPEPGKNRFFPVFPTPTGKNRFWTSKTQPC